MRRLSFLLLTTTLIALVVAPVRGAEITEIALPPADLILEGTIAPGDYDKIIKRLEIINADCPNSCARSIYLASPGGSLIEAMKIGRLVRTLRWETVVPSPITNPYVNPNHIFEKEQLQDPKSNHLCASACFFIFVAGTSRSSDELDVDENVILGIHRPYLTDTELRALSSDQAIASASRVRDVVEGYLKAMGVPSKYADVMFSIPKDEVRWIDSAEFHADFDGDIPELKDWIDARCNKLTDIEKAFSKAVYYKNRDQLTDAEKPMWDMLMKKQKAQIECEVDLRYKLQKDAWAQMFQPKGTWTAWWRGIWNAK